MTDELDPTPAVPSPTAARKLEAAREATTVALVQRLVDDLAAARAENLRLAAIVESLRASAEKRRR